MADDTLSADTFVTGTVPSKTAEELPLPLPASERYERLARLGAGGMGYVDLLRDRTIGRDIAMKVIHSEQATHPDVRGRFLREARIQGCLEHPSIVPVYDLALTSDGVPFFTMKRVRGRSLGQLLAALRNGDRDIENAFTERRLLNAFSTLCLAVELAHEHGVIHRDLKPDNVMLGDHGEVYILDWGLAKQMEAEKRDPIVPDSNAPTRDGAVLGTPGYMAPEQIGGRAEDIDRRADVYALGSILFEILTHNRLHEKGGGVKAVLASTLKGADARASIRAPEREVPPELEAICVRATALEREDRYPSARALHDALERYLEGARDAELRRSMAEQQASAGSDACALALSNDPNAEDHRRRALRFVGRALALDPSNTHATQTMRRLLETPLSAPPKEALAELEKSVLDSERHVAWHAVWAYMLIFALFPPVLVLGLKSWTWLFTLALLLSISAALTARFVRTGSYALRIPALIASSAAMGVLSSMFGPLLFAPALIAVNTLGFAFTVSTPKRIQAIVIGCAAFIIPTVLELVGVLPASYAVHGDSLLIRPGAHGFPLPVTIYFLMATNTVLVIASALFMAQARGALYKAELKLRTYTWSLAEMFPSVRAE